MNKRVFTLDSDGKEVLGFDTGLNAQAFAQAKIAAFITDPGFIVLPDGRVETWLPGGVAERETMIVWGPSFPGEELAGIINAPDRKDEALNALRFWLRAAIIIEGNPRERKETPLPGPAGAYIVSGKTREAYPEGTVFFPPARLLKRTIEAGRFEETLDAERWVHPDLEGAESIAFTAGAMLYRIFSGVSPFPGNDSAADANPRGAAQKNKIPPLDELRQNIREAVFIPPKLAAPGLDPELCGIITRAMSRVPQNREEKSRPSPGSLLDLLNSQSSKSKTASSWVSPLNEEERVKIRAEQEQYGRKTALAVKTRRFVIRNTAIITGILIGVVILVLSVRGFIKHQAELPTTQGMTPLKVAETYYTAFGTMDHILMEACVTRGAGKRDIEMVVNLFVMSRVRQAYESAGTFSMSAEEWIAAGRPVTDKAVFGVTDLNIRVLSEGETNVSFEADYTLWMPGAYLPGAETPEPESRETAPLPPGAMRTRDRLSLIFEKGLWHIAEIERESSIIEP